MSVFHDFTVPLQREAGINMVSLLCDQCTDENTEITLEIKKSNVTQIWTVEEKFHVTTLFFSQDTFAFLPLVKWLMNDLNVWTSV